PSRRSQGCMAYAPPCRPRAYRSPRGSQGAQQRRQLRSRHVRRRSRSRRTVQPCITCLTYSTQRAQGTQSFAKTSIEFQAPRVLCGLRVLCVEDFEPPFSHALSYVTQRRGRRERRVSRRHRSHSTLCASSAAFAFSASKTSLPNAKSRENVLQQIVGCPRAGDLFERGPHVLKIREHKFLRHSTAGSFYCRARPPQRFARAFEKGSVTDVGHRGAVPADARRAALERCTDVTTEFVEALAGNR